MSAGYTTDRMKLARLAVRVAAVRDATPPGRWSYATLDKLSPAQLSLIEEALKGSLTALTLRGYCWMRDVPEAVGE